MKPTLGQKRHLSSTLKKLHGEHWHPEMKPIYDERGSASIYISRFDPALVSSIAEFPKINWVEFNVDYGNDLRSVREMIALLIPSLADHLEYFEITNCNLETEPMRPALPEDPGCFEGLRVLERVVFDRVDLNDRTVKAICSNATLRGLDLRSADITKRCLQYIENCPALDTFEVARCRHFPVAFQETLRRRLPRVRIVNIYA